MKRLYIYLVMFLLGASCLALSINDSVENDQSNILQEITAAIEKEIAGTDALLNIMLNAPRHSALSEKLVDAIENYTVTDSLLREAACDRLSSQDVRVVIAYAMKMHNVSLATKLLDNLMGQLDQTQKDILLFDAIRMGDVAIVRRLLAAGAMLSKSDIFLHKKDIALAIALYRAEFEMVQELLHWSIMNKQLFSRLMISAAIEYAQEHEIEDVLPELEQYERKYFRSEHEDND